MQTLSRTQTKAEKAAQPDKEVQRGKHAFFAALLVFLILNLVCITKSPKLRSLKEIPAQAAEEAAGKSTAAISRHSWSWWLANYYLQEKAAPDVVLFGSSLIGSAHVSIDAICKQQTLDVLSHRRMVYLEEQLALRLPANKKPTVFSLASPGEMISDSFVITKALFQEGKKPKLVIATIAPRDFIDATLAYPGATDHYRFYSKFVNLENYRSLAYPQLFERMQVESELVPLKQKFPLNKYAEPAQSQFSEQNLSFIKPGDSVIPPGVMPPKVDNRAEYISRFKNPFKGIYEPEMTFFEKWLAELNKNNIKVLVVCMPTTKVNRDTLPPGFWSDFRKRIAAHCRRSNATMLDLSDCTLFNDKTDYLDTVHMNAYGAARLFPVLAERIAIDKQLP